VLAVSCPGGNPCLQRPPGKAVEGRMERRTSTASPPSLACQLSFLPYSRQEVEMISRIFGAGNTVLLEGESATEESIRSLELERFRLLHFATHALVDKDHWMRSSIVLLPDVEEGGEGLLQPKDIILWNLKADLVTLSSCQSGLGRIEAGEGVIGLAKVFHAAGASAVTASLWRILDKSTSLFMKDFYGGLYAGQRKSAALRRAKINMIRRGLDHPYYWGAFILYGDWNPLRRD
jgi:CHAT domain-containing protein